MQIPWHKSLKSLVLDAPSVGALVDLCEENYVYMLRIAPSLASMQGISYSTLSNHQDLHLEILEQSKYTTIVRLTYYFQGLDGCSEPDPDVVLRVYHDAKQLEVQSLNQKTLPVERLYESPGLLNKWRVSLFISKWLSYCCSQKHYFSET